MLLAQLADEPATRRGDLGPATDAVAQAEALRAAATRLAWLLRAPGPHAARGPVTAAGEALAAALEEAATAAEEGRAPASSADPEGALPEDAGDGLESEMARRQLTTAAEVAAVRSAVSRMAGGEAAAEGPGAPALSASPAAFSAGRSPRSRAR